MVPLPVGILISVAEMVVVGMIIAVARAVNGTRGKVDDSAGPEKYDVGNQCCTPDFPGWLTRCRDGTLASGNSSAKHRCTTGKQDGKEQHCQNL